MPIYEDMRQWVVDRQKAKVQAEAPDISPDTRIARERYAEWLDSERPDWLENMPDRPEAA